MRRASLRAIHVRQRAVARRRRSTRRRRGPDVRRRRPSTDRNRGAGCVPVRRGPSARRRRTRAGPHPRRIRCASPPRRRLRAPNSSGALSTALSQCARRRERESSRGRRLPRRGHSRRTGQAKRSPGGGPGGGGVAKLPTTFHGRERKRWRFAFGINGFGRIGRLLAFFPGAARGKDIEIVGINDPEPTPRPSASISSCGLDHGPYLAPRAAEERDRRRRQEESRAPPSGPRQAALEGAAWRRRGGDREIGVETGRVWSRTAREAGAPLLEAGRARPA
jgi:hypothetical protein